MSTLQQAGVTSERKHDWWRALIVAWALLVVVGVVALFCYDTTPGDDQSPPAQWPAETKITRADHQPTLVMFAHPRCPCTRASLEELQKTIARCQGKVTTWVVFYKPADAPEDWDHTDLWQTAKSIPGVHVLRDVDGVEARRFNAVTSGKAVLYDQQGSLQFTGGLTLERGHGGDNPGRDALESFVLHGTTQRGGTCVFGCPILSKKDSR